MDTKQIAFDMLIKQRETIISEIQEFTKTFHTCYFTLITFVAAIFSLYVSETIVITLELAFVFFQVFFLSILFLLGVLTSMNNNRDYIRAIDKYICDEYNVNTLFYQGELSYQHINKFNSKFSIITTIGALAMGVCIIMLGIENFQFILNIANQSLTMFVIFAFEILCLLFLIGKNIIYKITGKSKFYSDTFQYLSNTKTKAPIIIQNPEINHNDNKSIRNLPKPNGKRKKQRRKNKSN